MTSFFDFGRRAVIYASVFTFAVLAICDSLHSQDITRRMLDHSDYDLWNTLSRTEISNDGNWILYTVQSGEIDGEGTLHVQHTTTAQEYVVERGADAQITHDSRFVIYRVTPEKKKVKQLRKQKKQPDEMPQAELQILELDSGDLQMLHGVRSFQLPEENGDWVACLMEKTNDPSEIDKTTVKDREVYEVTPDGLRRPEKKLKLKSREEATRQRGKLETAKKDKREHETAETPSAKQESEVEEDDHEEKEKTVGTALRLINLNTEVLRTFPAVRSFQFSKNGKRIAFVTSVKVPESTETKQSSEIKKSREPNEAPIEQKPKGAADSNSEATNDRGPIDGVHIITLKSLDRVTIASGVGEYKNLAFNEDGSRLAFISNADDYKSKTPSWNLYAWNAGQKKAKRIASEADKEIPSGWWIAPDSDQRFSEDGRRLYFETMPIPDAVLEERLAKTEGREVEDQDADDQAKLDIWHWQDPELQPQQLLQAERERNRRYQAAYIIQSKRMIQLEDSEIPSLSLDIRSPANIAVANTKVPYRKTLSWEVPGYQDVYLVNLNSGRRERVLDKVRWDASLSPQGKYLFWFDSEQRKWFAKATQGNDAKNIEISKGIKYPLFDELDDRPTLPSAYGVAGWMENDRAVLVYDSHDIWKLDPSGKTKPMCITFGKGRKNDLRFRYLRLDRKERCIDASKPLILSAFHRGSKSSGFYALDWNEPSRDTNAKHVNVDTLRSLIMLDENLSELKKAKESDQVVFTRSTFRRFPDLWTSTTDFDKIQRVSDANPQQEKYSWGTAELTHWKAQDGQDLDGILLKPDDFDPSQKYPMLVYFYERNSDNLHKYYPPAAGRSIICFSFYVSRGYLVFIPDIPYTTGEPGQSAANSILPGVDHLVAQGFVDNDRIGMQGHSWGGYQTAYLVTQTDRFACAEAGAPVSNMTSAYGGIRWSTGMSRMFQYERTQSRIGEDLWSAREKYIANSPLFFADKINTPLLILHNDQDGAVPWYQGIELFVALRRLEKPAWMLNYNGDPHWVMGEPNRRDFAIRMQQFFDHYLQDAPEPEWMAVGVPAVEKGDNFGLDLLEPADE
ncbi:S9 family peptidase [Aporhodopirellula aestuarii]|uniref:Prolyl oligopeptidase family serine peptidase n=1 Tax=Aporhodopirellula aestuarii TaxID=2950107 RepID=A0ABT0TWV6_9BACT|nr:prolyl oligopeptidase family serine peptidase [Aporhodopirellula aestuarii]MCM2369089.1 prolyl oligopeptidase family serine peptidase [Aporhodopirellula aestuarii]